jgi:hypothetical protein
MHPFFVAVDVVVKKKYSVLFVVSSLPFRFRSTSSPGICDDTYYAGACHPIQKAMRSLVVFNVILEGSSCRVWYLEDESERE